MARSSKPRLPIMARTLIGAIRARWAILGLALMAVSAALLVSAPAGSESDDSSEPFRQGVHYTVLDRPFNEPANHVREWFWWGCPHCYAFEPILQAWANDPARDIILEQSPQPGDRERDRHAAIYLSAQRLGIGSTVNPELFRLAQEGRLDQQALADTIQKTRLEPEEFVAEFMANGQMRIIEIRNKAERSGIREVPSLVVAGKYRILGRSLESWDQMLEVADYLVAKASRE